MIFPKELQKIFTLTKNQRDGKNAQIIMRRYFPSIRGEIRESANTQHCQGCRTNAP